MSSEVKNPEAILKIAEHTLQNSTAERRRAGRMEVVSPVLIPLLRQPEDLKDAYSHRDTLKPSNGDTLKTAKGISAGLVISISLWGLIILAIRLIFW